MTNKDLDKIRAIANEHKVTPRPQAWARLSEGLGHKETKRKLSFYQKLSIAAAFVAVLSVGSLFNHYFSHHHDPDLFASNEHFKPIILEELGQSSLTSIYTVDDVNGLSDKIQSYSTTLNETDSNVQGRKIK